MLNIQSKPKVLKVVRPTEGGIGKHIISLCEGLRTYFDITIACPVGSSIEQKLISSGLSTLPLPLKGSLSCWDLISLQMLYSFMRKHNIKIVHAHGAKAALVARPAALLAQIPITIYTAHNSIINSHWPSWKNNLATGIESILAHPTDCIITVSSALGEEIAVSQGIPRKKIKIISNGIQPEQYNLRKELGHNRANYSWHIPNNCIIVGTVARFAPQKGLSVLIKAAARLIGQYNVHFLLVGDGPMKETLLGEVQAYGLNNQFTFTGTINDVTAAYRLMDIFVLPSLSEGLPLALLEAMAYSLPVVASRVGGIPEVLEHGRTGLMIEPGNHERLAEAIAHLADHSQQARLMGMRGKQRVFDHYSVTHTVNQTKDVYYTLLAQKELSYNSEPACT